MAAEFGVGTRRSTLPLVEVDDGNFDYDDKVLVETSQKGSRDFWIRPIGGVVNQQGPHTFVVEPQIDRYLHLNRAALEMRLKVVRADGSGLVRHEDIVAPINLLGPCMWKTVEVSLNSQPFNGASAVNAGYKGYIETMLSCDSDAVNSHLSASFFHADTPGEFNSMSVGRRTVQRALAHGLISGDIAFPAMDDAIKPAAGENPPTVLRTEAYFLLYDDLINQDETDPPAAAADGVDAPPQDQPVVLGVEEKKLRRKNALRRWVRDTLRVMAQNGVVTDQPQNAGFNTRYNTCSGSSQFDIFTPITHDFFRINNHVGPGNRIEVKLTPYPYEFLLNSSMRDRGYKLELLDMKMHLRTIERKERVPAPLRETYQMNETQLHKHVVGTGLPSTTFRIFNGGVMPKTIIVGLVNAAAADGQYHQNPFKLHHYFVNQMSLIINGEKYPSEGLRMDFTKENALIARSYHWMYENTGATDGERGNIVTWNSFLGGTMVVPFDLTPDKCNGLHNHDAEYGFIDLALEFSQPLPHPIYVLYEMVFNKVVVNDKLTNSVTVLDVEAG